MSHLSTRRCRRRIVDISEGLNALAAALAANQPLGKSCQWRVCLQTEVRQLVLRYRCAVSALQAVNRNSYCYHPSTIRNIAADFGFFVFSQVFTLPLR